MLWEVDVDMLSEKVGEVGKVGILGENSIDLLKLRYIFMVIGNRMRKLEV